MKLYFSKHHLVPSEEGLIRIKIQSIWLSCRSKLDGVSLSKKLISAVRYVSRYAQDTLLTNRIEKLTGWRPIDGFLRPLPWGSGTTDPWRVNPKAAFVPDRLVLFLSRSATLIISRTTSCPSLFIRFPSPFLSPSRSSGITLFRELFDIRRTSTIYSLRRANKVTLILPQRSIKR